ncbi:MAG: DUF362 domain-containing protein [bacterium]
MAVVTHEDKFRALDEAIERSGFLAFLDARCRGLASGAPCSRGELRIAIKPNLMMFVRRDEPDVITDPALVEHLVGWLEVNGFTCVDLVESQNVYSNWYEGRTVARVAEIAGYLRPFVDLTSAGSREQVSTFMGRQRISRALDAYDVMVSFAKQKTHPVSLVTLGLKNLFGLTFEPNKFLHYHGAWLSSWSHALLSLITDPSLPYVRQGGLFCFLDATTTCDGFAGFKSRRWRIENPFRLLDRPSLLGLPMPFPAAIDLSRLGAVHDTCTVIAGQDLLKVEQVAMAKLGITEPALVRLNFPFGQVSRLFGAPALGDIRISANAEVASDPLRRYDAGSPTRIATPGYRENLGVEWPERLLPWGARWVEKLYTPLNLACSTSPADPALFPKIPIFRQRTLRVGARVVAIVAWPGPLLTRSLRESLWLWRRNLARLVERIHWWNVRVHLGVGRRVGERERRAAADDTMARGSLERDPVEGTGRTASAPPPREIARA